MLKTTLGAAFAAALVAGLVTISAVAPASAESVMKQCGEEWKAAKAAGTTNGQKWSEFLKTCRAAKESGAAAATPSAGATPAPAATPAPTPVATATPTPTAVASPKPMATPKPTRTAVAATGAGEFANEAEAKAHCPTDTVVWVNTSTHKYHYSGNRSYGTTKKGAYMCEADAKAAGDAGAKNEKPKT